MAIEKCGGEVVTKKCALIAYRKVLAFKKLPRLLDSHSRDKLYANRIPENYVLDSTRPSAHITG